MYSKIVYSVAVLALAVLVFSPEGANSECCYASINGQCSDCQTLPFGKTYCGVGGCNMFGCDCDGGCKTGYCRKRRAIDEQGNENDRVEVENGNDVFRLADTDADGFLNTTEVKLFLVPRGVLVKISAFRALDVDGNGKLTAGEIDADLF